MDSKYEDITILRTPICLAKYIIKPTSKLSSCLIPFYFLLFKGLDLVSNTAALPELQTPKYKLLPTGTLVFPDTLNVRDFF